MTARVSRVRVERARQLMLVHAVPLCCRRTRWSGWPSPAMPTESSQRHVRVGNHPMNLDPGHRDVRQRADRQRARGVPPRRTHLGSRRRAPCAVDKLVLVDWRRTPSGGGPWNLLPCGDRALTTLRDTVICRYRFLERGANSRAVRSNERSRDAADRRSNARIS